MLDLSTHTDNAAAYAIKCQHCGKFIARKDIEDKNAKFHFTPSSQFGPEESYWICKKCL